MTHDPREGINISTVLSMFRVEYPELATGDVSIILDKCSIPDTFHIKLSNGDEYIYTITSLRTDLKKVEQKYILTVGLNKDDVLDFFCKTKNLTECFSCPLKNLYQGHPFGECGRNVDVEKCIETLLNMGIIEEVK